MLVSGVKYQCQVPNMSASGKLNTKPQYYMSGKHPVMSRDTGGQYS